MNANLVQNVIQTNFVTILMAGTGALIVIRPVKVAITRVRKTVPSARRDTCGPERTEFASKTIPEKC